MTTRLALLAAVLFAAPLSAAEVVVLPGPGALQGAIASASSGDVLLLGAGSHAGPVVLDRPLTLKAPPGR